MTNRQRYRWARRLRELVLRRVEVDREIARLQRLVTRLAPRDYLRRAEKAGRI